MKIEVARVLMAAGLRLLSHVLTRDDESKKLIAIDSSMNLVLLEAPLKSNDGPKIPTLDLGKVVNVISQGFTNASHEVLITAEKSGILTTYLADFTDSTPRKIFTSTSTPMVITNPVTLKPLIIYSDANTMRCGEITESKVFSELGTFTPSRLPVGIHTSSYIDITGNMNPNLVLHTIDEVNKNVVILILDLVIELDDNKNYTFNHTEIDRIDLGVHNIGPVMFSEMTSPINPDMQFISEVNGVFQLNLYQNNSLNLDPTKHLSNIQELKEIFNKQPSAAKVFNTKPITMNLSDAFPGRKVVIHNKDGTNFYGMFMSDTLGSGIKDTYIVTESTINGDGMQSIHRILFDRESMAFSIDQEFEGSKSNFGEMKSIVGMTMFDMNDSGIPEMILNITSEEEKNETQLRLLAASFSGDSEISNISLLPLNATEPQRNFIPGASFLVIYENDTKIARTNTSHQSSYLSLQGHSSSVGLNSTNLFINSLSMKVPCNNKTHATFDSQSFIVPNTFTVLTFNQKEWFIQCFFTNIYYMQTVIALAIILISFVVIYILLSIQDKKKYKTVMSRDSMRKVFNAL